MDLRRLIIAVDFDGTLCEMKFPDIGEANVPLVNALRELKKKGHTLILWTCREGKDLEAAIEWCKLHDLEFTYVNTDDKDIQWEPGRKVVADIYIDDRSFTPESFIKYYDQLVVTGTIKII